MSRTNNFKPRPTGHRSRKSKLDPAPATYTLSASGHRRSTRKSAINASKLKTWVKAEASRGSISAVGRSVVHDPSLPTKSVQPKDKSYKTDTYRLHWKGPRDALGMTPGNVPFIGTRNKDTWGSLHDTKRKSFGDWLSNNKMKIENPFGKHLAENSHVHAGSMFGPNDILSAPPASIHQNTEWLAIESGIKSLRKKYEKNSPAEELRIKSTGYVHEKGALQGTLKASRYKIYFGDKKVFDHVAYGDRNNIDKKESFALQNQVKGLTPKSGKSELHGTTQGIRGTPATQDEARDGQNSMKSNHHKQFTDLTTSAGKRLTGDTAFAFAEKRYK